MLRAIDVCAAANGDDWRSLEWQELALLQGFPDDYVFMGTPTRVIKMVVQAVEVRTAHAILTALCESEILQAVT